MFEEHESLVRPPVGKPKCHKKDWKYKPQLQMDGNVALDKRGSAPSVYCDFLNGWSEVIVSLTDGETDTSSSDKPGLYSKDSWYGTRDRTKLITALADSGWYTYA